MLCPGCVVSVLQINERLRCWLIIPQLADQVASTEECQYLLTLSLYQRVHVHGNKG